MELTKLFLTKDEIPILHDSCFQIPIHPKILDPAINIRPEIAKEIFPKVAQDWYNDLRIYANIEKDLDKKMWYEEVFLKKEPSIVNHLNHQFLNETWRDDIDTLDNGFVNNFSISRNAGGSLYFWQDEVNCESIVPNVYLRLSEEKINEFVFKKMNNYNLGFVYASHNIDNLPGALFLRNWAIEYMNQVFKEVF